MSGGPPWPGGVPAGPVLALPEAHRPVLQELLTLETRFHGWHPAATLAQFDALLAPEFWEIGASGRRYGRAFARAVLAQRAAQAPASAPDWVMADGHVAELAPGLWLLTYALQEPGRRTQRATLWRRGGEAGWQAVFHQGTVVAA